MFFILNKICKEDILTWWCAGANDIGVGAPWSTAGGIFRSYSEFIIVILDQSCDPARSTKIINKTSR